MERFEGEGAARKNPLEKIREIIQTSDSDMEAEAERSGSSWLSCYGSRIMALWNNARIAQRDNFISSDQYEAVRIRLELLSADLADLHKQFPQARALPEVEKQNLMSRLDELGELF